MSNRRKFIKNSSLLAAASIIMPSMACSSKKKESKEKVVTPPKSTKMEVGLQVYSVRNQLKNDFEGTMKKISEFGYQIIEGYGLGSDGMFLGKYSPTAYKKIITDLGMRLVVSHSGYFTSEDASQMIDAAKEAGLEYLVIPGIPGKLRESIDGYKAIAENFNKIGELCNASGLKFGYHNHAFEFDVIDGQIPMEVLIGETEKNLVHFEADLYWVTKGKYDPVKLINKYPGRIDLFHVKDANSELEGETVGKGIIDFKSIFEAGKKSGLKYYFIEDEREDNPFANIKADFDYISMQDFS